MRPWARAVLSIGLGACACACGAPRPERVADPAATTRMLAARLAAGDADGSYALLHPDLRETTSQAQFRARFSEVRAEAAEAGRELSQVDAAPRARAVVPLASGEQVTLVLDGGQWRIAGGVFDSTALATPRDAVAELRSALAHRSLPAIMRLLARSRRAELEATIEAVLASSADAADLSVDVNGDEAVVHLTGGGAVVLHREAGKWRLWDLR
jgi:hypothetical protein